MVLRVVLSGKFCGGRNPNADLLKSLRKDSGLTELNYDDDSIELVGSAKSVNDAIILLAKKDILQPDFSRTEGDLKVKKIKRLMRLAKAELFESLLDSNKPSCWGDMPWRFITPLTLQEHMTTMVEAMDKCYTCAVTRSDLSLTCFRFSTLKVQHEKKWMED